MKPQSDTFCEKLSVPKKVVIGDAGKAMAKHGVSRFVLRIFINQFGLLRAVARYAPKYDDLYSINISTSNGCQLLRQTRGTPDLRNAVVSVNTAPVALILCKNNESFL
jgi:hypothetical protein